MKRQRGLAFLCVLGLVPALSGFAAGAAPGPAGETTAAGSGLPYKIELTPMQPSVGGELQLDLVIRGFTAAGMVLEDLAPVPALSLESQTIGPYIGSDGERGAELRLVFQVLRAGKISIDRIAVRSSEGSLSVGPVRFTALGPLLPSGARERIWEWEAPDEVYRYEAFTVRLHELTESVPGKTSLPQAGASFTVPEGASLEEAGPLAWTATALAASPISLPDADMSSGDTVLGRAPGRTIRVRPLPPELEQSRAIGRFELSLEGLERARPRAGEYFTFRLVLSGMGNLPVLRLPPPHISLNGRALAPEALNARRLDDSRPSGEGYEGRVSLELTLAPPSPGRLEVTVPPIAVLEPGTGLRSLSVAPVSIMVGATSLSSSGAAMATGGPFDAAVSAASRLAAASDRFAALPALLVESRSFPPGGTRARKRALDLLSAGTGGGRSGALVHSRDVRYLEAALRWEGGERGPALALLYGLLRADPGFAEARRASALCAGELGAGPPLLDPLPHPPIFEAVGAAALAAGLLLIILARKRRSQLLGAAAGLALVLAAGCLVFSLVSAAGHARPYAVVWTDRLLLVPSPLAKGYVELPKGSTARVRGAAPGYVGLLLGDGLAGWAPRDSVYYY